MLENMKNFGRYGKFSAACGLPPNTIPPSTPPKGLLRLISADLKTKHSQGWVMDRMEHELYEHKLITEQVETEVDAHFRQGQQTMNIIWRGVLVILVLRLDSVHYKPKS